MKQHKTALLISLALAILGWVMPAGGIELKEAIAGKKIPFVIQLKDLGDDWRRVLAANTQSADWMQAFFAAISGQAGNTYYTRGETISVGPVLFLMAYRPQVQVRIAEIVYRNAAPLEPLSPDSQLNLCLLNLGVLGSMDDIRQFNLELEIEESKKLAASLAVMTRGNASPRGEEPKEPASSLGNLKQLALALLMYADDHDETLPAMESAASLKAALLPYVRNEVIFLHPATGEPYLFNSWLAGKNIASIEQPEQTVVFYEAQPNLENQLRAVAFLDGHTQFVDEARWQEIKAISHLP